MAVELTNRHLRAVISEQGGCVLAFENTTKRVPLLRPFADGGTQPFHPTRTGAFPLIPFANRVRGDGFSFQGRRVCFQSNTAPGVPYLHGDAWLGKWRIERQTQTSVSLCFEHTGDTVSPYTYVANQLMDLRGDALCVTMSVTNLGADPLPFGLGHHPYFPWRTGTQVRLGAYGHFWSEAHDYLPGQVMDPPADIRFNDFSEPPRRRINNVYDAWDGKAGIHWPDSDTGLSIEASEAFDRLMLFINTPERAPDYSFDSFCLEPMTHLPGGFDAACENGFMVLAPGESLAGEIRYRVT